MTATMRTTKAGQITRSVIISFALAGRCEVWVSETQGHKTTEDTYLLARQPSDFGAAFTVRKCSDEREVYDVLLSRNGHTCTCPWGTYKAHVKPCRHMEMCLQALREKKL
jgi:hypothetical protein